MKRASFATLVTFLLMLVTVSAFTQVSVPPLMNFQGRLAKPDGTPVADGDYSIRFSLWNIASGGTQAANEKWNQTFNPVTLKNGVFAVLLGSGNPLTDTVFGGNVWLEIKVGSDAPLAPRQPLVSVAYAFKADTVPVNAIKTANIADLAVTTAKIGFGAVTGSNLAVNSVTTASLGNLVVTDAKLADLSVWTTKLADLAVTTAKLADGSVTSGKLADNAVLTAKINNLAVTSAKLADLSVSTAKLADLAVTTAKLADGSVTTPKLADDAVTTVKVLDLAITDRKLADSSVTASKVASNAITTGKLADLAVTNAKIVNVDWSKITNAPSFTGWSLFGNAGTMPGTNFLGTTDNKVLEFKVNAKRALRLEPATYDYASRSYYQGVNTIGGFEGNSVVTGVVGATIGGGYQDHDGVTGDTTLFTNQVFDLGGTVGGGANNTAGSSSLGMQVPDNDPFATVGGGFGNVAWGAYSTIGGGHSNTATPDHTTIGGGENNTASGEHATVGGGSDNIASAIYATVGGGRFNTANDWDATVGGGQANEAIGINATVAGGQSNQALNYNATVGGGLNNDAWGAQATVGGGYGNAAVGDAATVGGGSGNLANKNYATVPGGGDNRALEEYSFAAGRSAHAHHTGSFVWADSTDASFSSTANNEFNVRASGGVRIFTNSTATIGVTLTANDSSWNSVSDRNAKTAFQSVDTLDVLERLVAIPISTWNYKGVENPIRHIGPMAQDFFAAFKVGMDDKHIGTIDADGVALAAIQGLNRKLEAKTKRLSAVEAQNAEMKKRQAIMEADNAELRAKNAEIEARLNAIETALRNQK